VAVVGADAGQSCVTATSGVVSVKSGTNSIAANDPLKADPGQPGCVMKAAITDAGIVGVAQVAASNGTVTALLQGL
jgi:hypothetical protein